MNDTTLVLATTLSGVTLLERRLRRTRPEYRDYVDRTNAFFRGYQRRAAAECGPEYGR